MRKHLFQILLLLLIPFAGCMAQTGSKQGNVYHTFNIKNPAELKEFFAYKPDRIPFICAHRGGDKKFFPENCIATFENTISQVHSMIETDPRYTKDSVIILMHDPTLERTTNGKGKVSDYTWEELKKLRLKDSFGNITDYRIPTLDEALEWAKSKTILVLDRKDVPIEVRVKKITEHDAVSNAIVIAYSPEEIKRCYSLNHDIIMEVMAGDFKAIRSFEETNVPWANVVCFVSHNLNIDPEIFRMVHEKGALCIAGSSRNHDLKYKSGEIKSIEELSVLYRKMITDGADIIEADLAIEAGVAIENFVPERKADSKSKGEIIACGDDKVIIIDKKSSEGEKIDLKWTWIVSDARDIPAKYQKILIPADDCKPVDGGKKILITSSGGGVVLVDRDTKKSLFYAHSPMAHSAEILPDGRVVVALSTHKDGNRIEVYDLKVPEKVIFKDSLYSGHGVVWINKQKSLFALGYNELRRYTLKNWNSDKPELRLEEKWILPDNGGHDLIAVSDSKLLLTTTKSVWLFNISDQKFSSFELLDKLDNVKSVNYNETTGELVYTRGEISWWTHHIYIKKPDKTIAIPGINLYKVRTN